MTTRLLGINSSRRIRLCLAALVYSVTFSTPLFSQSQDAPDGMKAKACRSVHLWWQNEKGQAPESVAFYNELTIEKSTRGSYFMACGFSQGYFGIQELTNGKKVALFSIWEPGKQNNPNATPEDRRVKPLAVGNGVRVNRFGGEGTGGKSMFDFDWKIGQSVRFIVFAKADGPHRTQYAGYIYLPDEHRWQHMATFSTLAQDHLLRGYYSFVEDFLRNGRSERISRRANFGNGWILNHKTQSWQPLTQGRFTADNTPTSNIDSGRKNDRIFLQTGGETKNQTTQLNGKTQLVTAQRKPPVDLPTPFADVEHQRSPAVRLLAYNIKHGRGNDGKVELQRTAQVIRRLNPDIVALQEVDNQVKRSGNINEPERLAKLTGLKHHAFGSFFDYQGGEYGMAIISRFPLSHVKNLRLPEGSEPRTSLIVQVDHPRVPFRVADVHFYRTEAERVAQAKTLLKELNQQETMPTVVLGDFNSSPKSPVLELFADWRIPDKGEDHFTFSSDKPDREIDFAMYRPPNAFKFQTIDVIDEPVASDHRPLHIDLKLTK
ncbi:MAG: DUF3472 domain-containing protein [Mariniblastus sp.]|nr:DUF3472 domain-containing protein [Mariniblastus sp.]